MLSADNSKMSRRSASVLSKLTRFLVQEQRVTPCSLQYQACPRPLHGDLGESRKDLAGQGEDPTVTEKQGRQRKGPHGIRGPQFRPLEIHGGLSSLAPRPGSLQRNLHAKSSEARTNKELYTSCVTSCPSEMPSQAHTESPEVPHGRRGGVQPQWGGR